MVYKGYKDAIVKINGKAILSYKIKKKIKKSDHTAALTVVKLGSSLCGLTPKVF